MRKIASEAGLPNTHFKKNYQHIAKQLLDGTISPQAMRSATDDSGSVNSQALLAVALDALARLEKLTDACEEDFLRDFLEDIDALYRFCNLIEVKEGLLVCPECGRWYPIGSAVETIPEMLPDDLREKERDIEWLTKWKEKIPKVVLEQGKPFTLGAV